MTSNEAILFFIIADVGGIITMKDKENDNERSTSI